MKLFYSPTSAYSRKVRIVVGEKALQQAVTLQKFDPANPPSEVKEKYPAADDPVLVLNNGQVIVDGRVICTYLDAAGKGARLEPSGIELWSDRTRGATGDMIILSVTLAVLEARRPEPHRNPAFLERQGRKFMQTIPILEAGNAEQPTLGDIGVIAALSFLDYCVSDWNWRHTNEPLANWYAAMESRPAMQNNPLG